MAFDLFTLVRYYPVLVAALGTTLMVTAAALALGIAIALAVSAVNATGRRALRSATRVYVNVFRNTPEVVVIFWFYFCLPQILDMRMSAFATGTLALGLSAGAFLSEIFRAGIESVPRGQRDAAQALGLSWRPLWTVIILPQAIRPMVPAFVNYLTELLKHSTLLSAIGVGELAHAAFTVGGQTFRYFEFFTAIGIIFFAMIFPLSLYARYLGRSHSAARR